MQKIISIVIPIYNEEEMLPLLYRELSAVKIPGYRKEVILVMDPSTDATEQIARGICKKDKSWKLVVLSRRLGQDNAIDVGLRHAKGAAAVVMDGDLQDPPALIPSLVGEWEKGSLVVSAARKGRAGENVWKKISSRAFNWLMRKVLNVQINPSSGNFKLVDRSIIDAYTSIRGTDKYFRWVDSLTDYRSEVFFDRPARATGETKYNIINSFVLAFNAMIFSTAALLRMAIVLSAIFMLLSIAYAVFIIYSYFNGRPVEGWASTNVFLSLFASMQFFALGAIGEYIYRNTQLLRGTPAVIKDKVNL
ncbi:MAG: glycosyltransferase family 2 protein [Candidatus Micrarchaeia archaeon]